MFEPRPFLGLIYFLHLAHWGVGKKKPEFLGGVLKTQMPDHYIPQILVVWGWGSNTKVHYISQLDLTSWG